MASRTTRYLIQQRRAERFYVWFEAMRLRAAMQRVAIENLTAEETLDYVSKPTAGPMPKMQSRPQPSR